jgi:predicted regulator of Ras-like GTPase activity (Roadblock/LC7/MglB family)
MNNSAIFSSTKLPRAKSVLRNLRVADPNIEACAMVSNDGRPVASELNEATNAERFSAMCAALIALATRAGDEVQRGELRQVILEGEYGVMLLTRTGDCGVLAVAAGPNATLGRCIISARAAALELGLLYSV